MELAGRKAVVTGAGQGLGAATARALAAAGAQVTLIGRSAASLKSVAAQIGAAAHVAAADIADPAGTAAAIATGARAMGGIDLLINNAAIFPLLPAGESPPADLRRTVEVNLLGPLYCIEAALPALRAAADAAIITISSESVTDPFPCLGLYAATKAALETYSQALRAELQPDGIRVSVIRIGALAGTVPTDPSWTPDAVARFTDLATRSGHLRADRAGMAPEAVAQAIVAVAAAPRSLSHDLLVLRPGGATT